MLAQLEKDQEAVDQVREIVQKEEAIMKKETQVVQDYADVSDVGKRNFRNFKIQKYTYFHKNILRNQSLTLEWLEIQKKNSLNTESVETLEIPKYT